MSDFFKVYKRYIIHHPNKAQYKPTADKAFDKGKLYDVYKEIVKDVEPKEEDFALISDFVRISQYLHDIYSEVYKHLNDDLRHLNLKGIEVAEHMRKENSELSIIFLTAYDKFEYARRAVSVHAMEYLLKPYSEREVVSVVEEAMRYCDGKKGEENRAYAAGMADKPMTPTDRMFVSAAKYWLMDLSRPAFAISSR